MKEYNHLKIEKKWQKYWEEKKTFKAKNDGKKFYSLIEFPYPSGSGLHVGHIRSNTAMDIISRKRRMEGYNVLYPIGWDAFGLPTENYAIKTGIEPAKVTKQNTDTFRKQLKTLGFSFDWSREVNTTDPAYYKWTQWIFLKFLEKGLAYKAKSYINWCPSCKIGLANEEAVGGICERCGTETIKKEKEQWMLGITKYADRLDKDLDFVDYPERVKTQQRNWIGKSEGALIKFDNIEVFTTRPDTIFGATFIAVAGKENRFTGRYVTNPATKENVPVWEVDYVMEDYGTGALMGVPAHDERDFEFSKKYKLPVKTVVERLSINATGQSKPKDDLPFIERNCVDVIVKHWSLNKYLCLQWKKVDWRTFVTGGIEKGQTPEEAARMEVREETGYTDLKFIKEIGVYHSKFYHGPKKVNKFAHFHGMYFELQSDIQEEVIAEEKEKHELHWVDYDKVISFIKDDENAMGWNLLTNESFSVFTGEGILVNSGKFSSLTSQEAKKQITEFVGGKMVTKYKLRDWIFSRQRYWGEPIPVIFCAKCGIVPVSEKDLPVELPKVKNYQPTDNGESPLANISKWVNVKCPKCKGPAERETDTMPNWAGSSWYYLRYTDPKNKKEFASKKNLKYWLMPKQGFGGVDWYNGGMEHTTLHLLYSRFWHKFLYDLKLVPTPEPYRKRTSHGMILAEGGDKMSKSKGNVINPDDIVKTYGADTLRLYEMFIGPFEQSVAWNTESIIGSRRFIEKVWRIGANISAESSLPGSLSPRARGALPLGPSACETPCQENSAFIKKLLHKTIKKVSEDIENMRFNTAVSSMMILTGEMEKMESIDIKDYKKFLKILAPFAPHITEEIWQSLGEKKSIILSSWPKWDESLIKDTEIKIMIQVNGKVRAEIMVGIDAGEAEIKDKALKDEGVLKHISGKDVKKVIYVKNRLINIVV